MSKITKWILMTVVGIAMGVLMGLLENYFGKDIHYYGVAIVVLIMLGLYSFLNKYQ